MQDSPGSSLPPEHPESQDTPVPALLSFNTYNHELEALSGQRETAGVIGQGGPKYLPKIIENTPQETNKALPATASPGEEAW